MWAQNGELRTKIMWAKMESRNINKMWGETRVIGPLEGTGERRR